MWSLKFTAQNIDSIYTILTEKYAVTDYFYPVDFYRLGKNKVHILGIHILEVEEKEKDKFTAALKKHHKTKKLERQGDTLIVLMQEEESFYDLLYDPQLYHPAPVLIQKGSERWHVASWDRKKLEKVLSTLESWKDKFPEVALNGLHKTNFDDIYFPKIRPVLPGQQKKAFQLALEKGYYTWPRKADLQDLAKLMGISTSTYQEHLRKAEARLLPFFAGQF